MANLFLPQLITWFRLDEHVKRLKGRVDELEANPPTPATPTLQQVTTQGNTTDQNINIVNTFGFNSQFSVTGSNFSGSSTLVVNANNVSHTSDLGTKTLVFGTNGDYTLYLPNESGTLATEQYVLDNTTVPYNTYSALLTQSGTDAPTALVKQSLDGITVSYTYTSPGVYKIVFSSPILTETNHRIIQGAGNQSSLVSLWVYYNSATELILECYNIGNTNITIPVNDEVLINQYIEIQIDN